MRVGLALLFGSSVLFVSCGDLLKPRVIKPKAANRGGLSGAHGAVGAAAVHTARIAGYGAGGMLDPAVLSLGAALAASILLGNLLGDRGRALLPKPWVPRLEIGVVVMGLSLAVVGMR